MYQTVAFYLFLSFIALVLGFVCLMEAIEKKKILAFVFPVIFFYTSMLFAAAGVGAFFHG